MSGLDLTLLRPAWLVALIPLAGIAWWAWTRRAGVGDWDKAADPTLMKAMAALGRIDPSASRMPLIMMLSVLTVSIVALSGPAIERRDALSYRNLDGVLFLVDASPSVTENDRWPQMLTMGRLGLASLGTRPGGLIVFAGDAYMANNMTADHLQLGQTMSLISAESVPDPGTRPERALTMAAGRLSEAEVIAGDVILMTDGAGLGPLSLQAAAAIAEQGARLSIVSLIDPVPEMQTHAAVGGGRVFQLSQTDEFGAWLAEDTRTRLELQDFPLLFWQDLGRYVLLLALVPLLTLFRRESA